MYIGPKFYIGIITLISIIIYAMLFKLFVLNKINVFKSSDIYTSYIKIDTIYIFINEFVLLFITTLFCLVCILSDPGALPVNIITNTESYLNNIHVSFIL